MKADFNGAVGSGDSAAYLSNVVTSTALPPPAEIWNNAGTQQCVHVIKKAYPSDGIRAFNASLPESEQTWTSVEIACSDMALFEDIAKAAGKNLTVSSFVHAGYGLKNLVLPAEMSPSRSGRTAPTGWVPSTWRTTTRRPSRWCTPIRRALDDGETACLIAMDSSQPGSQMGTDPMPRRTGHPLCFYHKPPMGQA